MPGRADDKGFHLRVLLPAGPLPAWLGQALLRLETHAGLVLAVQRLPHAVAEIEATGLDRAWRRRVPALRPWPGNAEEQTRLTVWESAGVAADPPDAMLTFQTMDGAWSSAPAQTACWLVDEGHGGSLLETFPALDAITASAGLRLRLQHQVNGDGKASACHAVHVAASPAYPQGLTALAPAVTRLVLHAVRAASLGVPLPGKAAPAAQAAVAQGSAAWPRLLAGASRAWLQRQQARLFSEYWRIGLIDAPIGQVLMEERLPPVRWITPKQTRGYWADPFGLPGNDKRLACEYFDEQTGIGRLEWLDTAEPFAVPAGRLFPRHDAPHASFPLMTVLAGQRVGVAETVAERRCVLHRLDDRGHWHPWVTMLQGVGAADPAVFEWGGRCWLAYTDTDIGELDNLCLAHATTPEGPWTSHANNPVKLDITGARMAGVPFVLDGALYRPAQDCLQTYGAAVVVHRIDVLTPDRYEETPVRRIVPDPQGSCADGLHTLNAWGERTLIDGKSQGLNLTALWRKLSRRWPSRAAGATALAAQLPLQRIFVYVPHLRMGGGETSMLRLAHGLAALGYEVHLVVHTQATQALEIPAGVRLLCLDCGGTARALWPLVRALKQWQPRWLLSAFPHTNVAALLARRLARTPTRCLVTEHAPLSHQIGQQGGWRYRLLPALLKWAYPQADAVVAVSKGVAADLSALLDGRVQPRVIHNAVLPAGFEAEWQRAPEHAWLSDPHLEVVLSVCRLGVEKDLPTLVQAFAILHRERPAARLLIVGEGPERARLDALVVSLGLAALVQLPGSTQHPLTWMRYAAVLALSSRFEGFGNVLVEALACGTPVVSTDCPVGPREILQGGRLGRLVPVGDAQALAAALLDSLVTRRLPEGATEAALEFSEQHAAQQTVALMRQLEGEAARC